MDAPGAHVEPDGPPPTPHERARAGRRRRWQITLVVVALLALALPAAALLVVTLDLGPARPGQAAPEDDAGPTDTPGEDGRAEDAPADPPDAGTDGPGEQPSDEPGRDDTGAPPDPRGLTDADRPDPLVPDEDRIDLPEVGSFTGVAADQVRLLTDIDASERAMLAFQVAVGEAVFSTTDVDELRERIVELADDALEDLDVLRALLGRPLTHPGTARVRDRYVEHLDTWIDYLEAIEDRPDLVFGETSRYTIPINVTGSRFTREVEALVEQGVDDEVRRVAEAIVERGFAGPEQSQV